MSPAELVGTLAERGATLTLGPDGRVRYHGLAEVLTQDLREALRAHLAILPEVLRRAEVFQALVRPGQPLPLLCLPGARGAPSGRCLSCGGDLAGGSYRCGPCGEAARLVAGDVRELSSAATLNDPK